MRLSTTWYGPARLRYQLLVGLDQRERRDTRGDLRCYDGVIVHVAVLQHCVQELDLEAVDQVALLWPASPRHNGQVDAPVLQRRLASAIDMRQNILS